MKTVKERDADVIRRVLMIPPGSDSEVLMALDIGAGLARKHAIGPAGDLYAGTIEDLRRRLARALPETPEIEAGVSDG